ncbi:MAG: amino acid permease [Proteobacteria bacterium]|nr:amino acid permease [Pseudomonadota bacterium]
MITVEPEAPQLKRSLSLSLVTLYGIGTILGAGIYVLVGKVAGYAGMFTPIAFLVSALLAAFSALSYAELSARFPKSAGEAVYVHEGLQWRHLSIIVGVTIALSGTISTATLVHGFVGYFEIFFQFPPALVMIVLIVLLASVVIWGISQSVVAAALMTVVEIGGLVMIIWVARDGLVEVPASFPTLVPSLELTAWHGIMLGSIVAFYAFLGFEDIVNVAEEVRNPSRNLPLAIILALVVTTVFYMLVAVVSIMGVPPRELAQTDAPLAMLYTRLTGNSPVVISLISLVAVLNGALIQMIMASRVLYGMSRQGWLPPWLGRVNRHTRTPLLATLVVTGSVTLFSLWLPLLSLAQLTSFITLIIFALINLSLWQIKRRVPVPADIRTIPVWVPVSGFVSSSAFVIYQAAHFLWGEG